MSLFAVLIYSSGECVYNIFDLQVIPFLYRSQAKTSILKIAKELDSKLEYTQCHKFYESIKVTSFNDYIFDINIYVFNHMIVITDAVYYDRIVIKLFGELDNNDNNKNDVFLKYQNMNEIDKLFQIKRELDGVVELVHEICNGLNKRQDELNDLMIRAEKLSVHSDAFAEETKKMNNCCYLF